MTWAQNLKRNVNFIFQKMKRNSKLSMEKTLRCAFSVLLKGKRVFNKDRKEIQGCVGSVVRWDWKFEVSLGDSENC